MADPIHDAAQAPDLSGWVSELLAEEQGLSDFSHAEIIDGLSKALAARAQPTNDEVLYEADTVFKPTQPGYPDDLGMSQLPFGAWFEVPPGTHVLVVRVVRATDQPSEGKRTCGDVSPEGVYCVMRHGHQTHQGATGGKLHQWPADQPSEDQP